MVLLVNVAPAAQAATDVPQEVLDAVDSVVYVTHLTELTPEEAAYLEIASPKDLFKIQGNNYTWESAGSGFIIKNENGVILIATNNHVVSDNYENIYVCLTENKVAHAEVVFAVPEKDLSVIRIRETTSKKTLVLAEEDAQRGEAVYAVGFPGASNDLSDTMARTSEFATITDGIISVVRSFTLQPGGTPAKLLQMNAAINHGNSGGPLFDAEGKVIGVNTLGPADEDAQGIFGAVAVSELLDLLDQYGIELSSEEPKTVASTPSNPGHTEASGWAGNQKKLILACVVIVCAAVLMLRLRPEEKCRKSIPDGEDRIRTDEKKSSDNHFVRLKLDDNVDTEITLTGKNRKHSEKKSTSDEYFKGIKL